jgi:ABC-type polysaccharide/polyol phosphate export permease
VLWRNALVFLNQAIVAVLVVIAFGQRPHALLGLLGIGLLLLQGLWIVLLLGVLGARFRDLGPLVQLTFQILFFVTPIIWTPAMLGRENSWIATVNPLFHVIEVVRAPLLGGVPSPVSYAGALVTLCLGLVVALGVYARFRDRIVYWL